MNVEILSSDVFEAAKQFSETILHLDYDQLPEKWKTLVFMTFGAGMLHHASLVATCSYLPDHAATKAMEVIRNSVLEFGKSMSTDKAKESAEAIYYLHEILDELKKPESAPSAIFSAN